MLAAVGLVENSSVVLVASMLVSPMMVSSFIVVFFSCEVYSVVKNIIGSNSSWNFWYRNPRSKAAGIVRH